MKEKCEYLVQISLNLFEFKSFEIIQTFLGYGALKSIKGESIVRCDSSSSSHSLLNQTSPCTQFEVGEHESQSVDLLPYSSTPHIQDLNASFNFEFDLINDTVHSHSPSASTLDPPNFEPSRQHYIITSSDSKEDQVQDGINKDKRNCDIFNNDYVWDSNFE